jgi:hypothetical protein
MGDGYSADHINFCDKCNMAMCDRCGLNLGKTKEQFDENHSEIVTDHYSKCHLVKFNDQQLHHDNGMNILHLDTCCTTCVISYVHVAKYEDLVYRLRERINYLKKLCRNENILYGYDSDDEEKK